MVELLVLGAIALAVLMALGLVWAVISLVFWLLVLPFKLLALTFKGIAVVLAAPFLLVAAILGVGIFGVGALLFLAPALPFVLLILGILWLMRRRSHPSARASV